MKCGSCDAQFLDKPGFPGPQARCPRCGEPASGPRRQRMPYHQPALTPLDLVRPVTCATCGCILSQIERVAGRGACHHPACLHRRVVANAAAQQEQAMADLQARQKERMESARDALLAMGLDPAIQPDIAVLPANERALVEVGEDRRAELRSRLEELVRAIALPAATTASARVNSPPKALDIVAQGCITCRGECCRNGDNRAYLSRATLEAYLEATPGLTPEELVTAYLDHVPSRAYEGSCIYHSEVGCSLSRPMRSSTCNEFYCSESLGLSSLAERLDPPARVIAAAMIGTRVVRLAVIDHERCDPLGDGTPRRA